MAGAVAVAEYPMLQMPGHLGSVELVARAWQLVTPDSREAERLSSRHVLINDRYRGKGVA